MLWLSWQLDWPFLESAKCLAENPEVNLRGRTLGLHGFGFVARNVFRIARALGMKVIVYTHYSKHAAAAIGLKVTHSLEQLYEKSDVVSIHVPAKGEHIKSVSYKVLKHLKSSSLGQGLPLLQSPQSLQKSITISAQSSLSSENPSPWPQLKPHKAGTQYFLLSWDCPRCQLPSSFRSPLRKIAG